MARPPPARKRWPGTSVTISASGWSDDEGVSVQLAEFTDRTGITVEFTPDEAQTLWTSTRRTRPPPGCRSCTAGAIPAWAEARAMDIGRFVDPETLRSDFGEYLLSAGTTAGVGGVLPADARVSAIPSDVDLKGLVFYPKGRVPRGRVRDPEHVGRARRAVSSDRG